MESNRSYTQNNFPSPDPDHFWSALGQFLHEVDGFNAARLNGTERGSYQDYNISAGKGHYVVPADMIILMLHKIRAGHPTNIAITEWNRSVTKR